MTLHLQGFHDSHDRLLEQTSELAEVAAAIPTLSVEERTARLAQLLEFLRTELEPHTRLDERLLYPEIATRMRAPLATASMSYDHLAIRRFIRELGEADPGDVARLQQLLYGLDALVRVHIWKENELYLGALESSGWPAAGQ
jgi:iron-sulfur cluster repair protein YtfE (RIC family)